MKNWFVLNTKPKKEFQIEKIFTQAGFEIYNPKYLREKSVRPFFPGYAFIVFDHPAQYQLVKFTRGVKKIVGHADYPTPIPESVIYSVKAREINGLIELEKHGEEPKVGDMIEVAEGPLKGMKGIFKKEIGDKERVMILLNFVSYQGQLLIEKAKLRKVSS